MTEVVETASPSPQEAKKPVPATEEEKLREAKRLAAKLRAEQLQLQQKAEERRRLQQQRMEREFAEERQRLERERQQSLEAKSQKLLELQEKAKRRKETLSEKAHMDQTSVKHLGSIHYARDSLEEDFNRRVVQMDLEMEQRRKAKNKLVQKCPTLSDLRSHAMKYDEVIAMANERIKEKVKQRRIDIKLQEASLFPQTQFSRNILERDREEKQRRDKEEERRKLMKLRQDRYALLVKEMFAPKQAPYDRLSESPRPPARVRYTPPPEARPKVKPQPQPPESLPSISSPSPQRKIDYLKEMRMLRESVPALPLHIDVDWTSDLAEDLPEAEKMKRVREKTDKVEKQLRRAEALLSLTSPTSPGALEATQKMSDTLVSSIQAKLKLIKA